jgi:hypothetical protein
MRSGSGENGFGQNLGPTSQVRPSLGLKIPKLDRDSHGQNYTRKEKTA